MARVKILIAEDIPAKNKGEAALFYGLVESLDCIENKEIILLSTDLDDDRKYYGHQAEIVDATGIIPAHCVSWQATLFRKTMNYAKFILKHILFILLYKTIGKVTFQIFRRPIWKTYIDADIVLMGHDSSWTPLYHSTMFAVMGLLKKPCFVYAGSLTPSNPLRSGFYRNIAEAITRWTLKKATLITLRETISERMINDIGINKQNSKIEIYPDLAFLVPPADEERIIELLSEAGISADETLIGMAFNRRTLRHAYPSMTNDDERVTRAIKDISVLAQTIKDKYAAKLVFIPHSIGPTQNLDDRIIARRIIKGMRNADNVVALEGDYWVHELKGIASKFQLSISSRLHFCIDTLSSEVPALFVTYSNDIRGHGIIGEMMDRREYVYNVDDMEKAEDLITKVDAIWNKRNEIRSDLKNQLPDIRLDTKKHGARVYQEFLSK